MSDTDRDLDNQSDLEEEAATAKPGGLGADGTIPASPTGVAAGHTGEATHFEPEEDEQADS